jgi:hypothetical protein
MRRPVMVGASLLGVIATAALLVIALSLRTVADEEEKQASCARVAAAAVVSSAVLGDNPAPRGLKKAPAAELGDCSH